MFYYSANWYARAPPTTIALRTKPSESSTEVAPLQSPSLSLIGEDGGKLSACYRSKVPLSPTTTTLFHFPSEIITNSSSSSSLACLPCEREPRIAILFAKIFANFDCSRQKLLSCNCVYYDYYFVFFFFFVIPPRISL